MYVCMSCVCVCALVFVDLVGGRHMWHVHLLTAYAEELPAAARIRLVIVSADKDRRRKPITMCTNHQQLNYGKCVLHNRDVNWEGCQGFIHACLLVTMSCMLYGGPGVSWKRFITISDEGSLAVDMRIGNNMQ